MAKSSLHYDGEHWRYGPARHSEKWAREYCKKKGLVPSSLRSGPGSSKSIMKKRPASKALLQKLKEVIRQHLEGEEDFGVEVWGDYLSWKESNFSNLMVEKEEKCVEFSLDFSFVSYT